MEPTQEIGAKNIPYYELRRENIYTGFQLCRANSKSLYDSAQVVSNSVGNYGTANSLLILAAEECIKGMALVSVYFNVPVPFLIEHSFIVTQQNMSKVKT